MENNDESSQLNLEFLRVIEAGHSSGGDKWDEKGRTKIARIFITFGDQRISSLRFQYVEDGKLVLSEYCGNNDRTPSAPNLAMVTLDRKNEYITGISGIYDDEAIVSLTFETNLNKYGPYGLVVKQEVTKSSKNTKFSYRIGPGNHFGGFYGTFDDITRLTSIGLYVITT